MCGRLLTTPRYLSRISRPSDLCLLERSFDAARLSMLQEQFSELVTIVDGVNHIADSGLGPTPPPHRPRRRRSDVDVLPPFYDVAMRGDRVEVTVDVGTGVKVFEVVATRAGRRVEVTTGRTVVEVAEVTRGGTAIRTARFMASRVVALVEHPSSDAKAEAQRTTATEP